MSKPPKPRTRKEKKAALRQKNRALFEIFTSNALLNDKVDIAAPEIVAEQAPEKTVVQLKEEDALQKMQQIRNRVSGRRRAAKDRWNRFAGTSGSGGRGR